MGSRLSISLHVARWSDHGKRNGSIAALPRTLVLALMLFVLAWVLPSLAAGSQSQPRSVLADAPGLEKPVTYSETKIPLGELVARVAADTGVALTAAPGVADEPVAVVVIDFPARELLEQLAALLDYRWSRRTTNDERPTTREQRPASNGKSERSSLVVGRSSVRYEIYQDVAGRQREEALRQAMFAGLEQRFQEEMAIGRELAGKSQEEMERLWEERTRWNERLQKLTPREQQALEHSPEGQAARKYQWLRTLWSPIQRSLAGWTLRLPREQWAAVRAGQALIFSSDPQRGELRLPPDVLRVLRTSRPVLPPANRPEQEADLRQAEQKRQARWGQAEQYRVSVRFGLDPPTPGQMVLWVLARPLGGNVDKVPWQEESVFAFWLSASPEDTAPTLEEEPRRRALLEQDPVLSVKKSFQPDARPYVDPLFLGASRPLRFLPEYLPGLARAYGVNFIADSYWMAEIPFGVESIGGTAPLFEVLDRLAGTAHAWDRREKLIRIRDRKWYLDRPAEIPLRLVRRWVAVSDRLGALPLAEFAVAASTLTNAQIAGLIGGWFFPPQLADLRDAATGALEKSRYLLRLYGGLSPAQQKALWAGKPLAIAQLSPAQRALVLAELGRIAHTRDAVIDLDGWQSGYLVFSSEPDVRIRERHAGAVAFRLESEPAAGAATRPDEVVRFPVTHLQLKILWGSQEQFQPLRLTVAAEPGGAAKL